MVKVLPLGLDLTKLYKKLVCHKVGGRWMWDVGVSWELTLENIALNEQSEINTKV